MADTYVNAHFHVVFAVKYRRSLINPSWKQRLHQYMIGIIRAHGHCVLALNSMPDHVHLLFGYNINETIPHLMQHLKRDSTRWINEQGLAASKFAWQNGYGAFVVERSRIDAVVRYILNQEQHHAGQNMITEFRDLLTFEGMDFRDDRIIVLPE